MWINFEKSEETEKCPSISVLTTVTLKNGRMTEDYLDELTKQISYKLGSQLAEEVVRSVKFKLSIDADKTFKKRFIKSIKKLFI